MPSSGSEGESYKVEVPSPVFEETLHSTVSAVCSALTLKEGLRKPLYKELRENELNLKEKKQFGTKGVSCVAPCNNIVPQTTCCGCL